MTFGMAALYHSGKGSHSFSGTLIECLTNVFFINFMCFFFLVMALFAHLMWLAERFTNAVMFPKHCAPLPREPGACGRASHEHDEQ